MIQEQPGSWFKLLSTLLISKSMITITAENAATSIAQRPLKRQSQVACWRVLNADTGRFTVYTKQVTISRYVCAAI